MKTEIKAGMGLAALATVVIVAFLVFGPKTPEGDTPSSTGPTGVEGRRVAISDTPITPVIPPEQPAVVTPVPPVTPPTTPVTPAEPPVIAVGPATQPVAEPSAVLPTTQPAVGLTEPARTPPAAPPATTTEEPADWRVLLAGGTASPSSLTPGMAPPGTVRPGSTTVLPPLTGGATPASRGDAGTYTVRPGDTLSSISNTLFGSPNFWSKIAQANPGVNSNRLRVGQVLVIPPESEVRGTGTVRTEPASGSALVKDPTREYQVVAGDSLSRISQQLYGTPNRWREIYELNKDAIGASPTRLRVGMVLKLPAPPTTR